MFYEFFEKSMIIIPFILKDYRLEEGEKLRFRCTFKTPDGDYPYVMCFEEDNKGADGSDGYYTMSLDMKNRNILPGRYLFSLELVFASGSSVGLTGQNEAVIEIIPEINGKECGCSE